MLPGPMAADFEPRPSPTERHQPQRGRQRLQCSRANAAAAEVARGAPGGTRPVDVFWRAEKGTELGKGMPFDLVSRER